MFKVGDKVKCIDASLSGNRLVEGRTYLVEDTAGTYVKIKGVDNFSRIPGWHSYRFALVEKNYPSPIETIPAKRVLKAGVYGKLCVHTGVAHSDMVGVSLTNVDVHGVTWLGVDDLDELIFTLTQVREFLKDG
jgi:hypothetical protein